MQQARGNRGMFFRLLRRAAAVRRGRTLTALLGITVGCAVATTMLNLYADIDSKLTAEFSKFGANIIVAAKQGESFTSGSLHKISSLLNARDTAIPVAYAVARAEDGRPVVVVGADIAMMSRLNPSWSITGEGNTSTPLVGARAASILARSRTLTFKGRSYTLPAARVLRTGGPEDSRIFLPFSEFEKWTAVAPSTVEIYVAGSNADISATVQRLQAELSGADVHPVRQVVETETRVLGKTRTILLSSTLMIALMIALCVLATLTASVLEQRKDFALMKALGSSQRAVNAIFISESLALGTIGAVLGFALGCGLAAWIGKVNFHASIVPHLSLFLPVLIGCLVLTLLSAVIPLAQLQKLQPAVMLRGD
jgi:putative ABC transport system permease protein